MKPTNNPDELSCWVLSADIPNVGTMTRIAYAAERPTAEDRDPRPSSYFKDLKKPEWDALVTALKNDPDIIKVNGPFEVPEAKVAMVFDQMPVEPNSCFSNIPCNITMLGPITDEDVLESDSDLTVIRVDQQKFASTLVSSVVDIAMIELVLNGTSLEPEEECLECEIDEIEDEE